jgi:putative acetyltransferase
VDNFPYKQALARKKDTRGTLNQHVVIRDETDADVSAITEVTITAFKTLEISNKTEQYIISFRRRWRA